MKVIVAGSRTIRDFAVVRDAIKSSLYDITELVSGKCPKGVDALGERYARGANLPIKAFPADWNNGRGAGFARNVEMAKYADAAVVVWDGVSKGSKHMHDVMKKLGKPVHLVIECVNQRTGDTEFRTAVS